MSAEDESRGPGRPRLVAGEETRRIFVKLPISLLAEVDAAAEEGGVSRSDYVRLALTLAMKRKRRPKKG